jgi:hypothetical protein
MPSQLYSEISGTLAALFFLEVALQNIEYINMDNTTLIRLISGILCIVCLGLLVYRRRTKVS